MNPRALLSEHVERAALEEIHRAAPDDLREHLGLRTFEIGSALVSVCTTDPSTLLNRTVGLGIDLPASPETVDAILARYREHGVGNFYLHLHPEARPSELREWIVGSGLKRGRGWMKFRRGRESPPPARSDLEIRRVDDSHAGDFGRIVADGFGLKPESAALLAALVNGTAWRLFLALDGETPAGAAAMFVHEGAAWLDWAATLPRFRGRGAQSSLLRRRILDALDAGCADIFTETGEAVGDDPQHSYRNILRFGFEPADLRENFVPAVG